MLIAERILAARKGNLSANQFEQDDPHRVHIRVRANLVVRAKLFRRRVARRPDETELGCRSGCFVFDKLGDLKNGDLITTTNGRGESVTYKVTRKKEYAKDKVPMQKIFEKSDDSRLEIITCAGKWQSDSYDNRLVVSAELVK